MNYEFYTARDFAQDEYFQDWVLHPDVKNCAFWEGWIQDHPSSENTIKEAVELIRSINFRAYKLSENEKDKIWDGIWDGMNAEEDVSNSSPAISIRWAMWRRIWKYAAVVMVGLTVFAVWKIVQNHSERPISFNIETKVGEVRKVILPDSSEVMLNANSSVVYTENSVVREAWLNGEVYFHVVHKKDTKPFIVHTYNDVSVKVLGTRFNVNTFGKKISVVLEQGSIQLGISDSARNETKLYLKPGEMINYNKQTGDYSKSRVETEQVVSWKDGRLVMDHYSLKDVQSFVRDVFGKELIIKDSSLSKVDISGSMPIVYDLDTMLMQFGRAFRLQFKQGRNGIWVEK